MEVISSIKSGVKKKKKSNVGKKYGRKESELSINAMLDRKKIEKKEENSKLDNVRWKSHLNIFYLDPISYHNVFGVVVNDKSNNKNSHELNFAESINIKGRVTGIGYDKENKIFILITTPVDLSFTPWRLLHTRLLTLGDGDAKDMAESVEKYSLFFEAIENLNSALFSEENNSDSFMGADTVLNVSEEDKYQSVKDYLNQFSNYGYYGFVRKGACRNICRMKMVETLFNQNLVEFLEISHEDFIFSCLRKGFPEFITPESYFNFWSCYLNIIMGYFHPFDVRIKTRRGRYKYARLLQPESKYFFLDGYYYFVIVIPFDLKYIPTQSLSDKPKVKEVSPDCHQERNDDYIKGNLLFFDQFYPEFSKDLREKKISGQK